MKCLSNIEFNKRVLKELDIIEKKIRFDDVSLNNIDNVKKQLMQSGGGDDNILYKYLPKDFNLNSYLNIGLYGMQSLLALALAIYLVQHSNITITGSEHKRLVLMRLMSIFYPKYTQQTSTVDVQKGLWLLLQVYQVIDYYKDNLLKGGITIGLFALCINDINNAIKLRKIEIKRLNDIDAIEKRIKELLQIQKAEAELRDNVEIEEKKIEEKIDNPIEEVHQNEEPFLKIIKKMRATRQKKPKPKLNPKQKQKQKQKQKSTRRQIAPKSTRKRN